jgi:hypothetical protein
VAHDGRVGQNPNEATARWGGEADHSTPVWYRTQFSNRAKGELTGGRSPWGHDRATGTRRQLAGEEVEGALMDTGGGYHLGAPNIISDHSSSFPSSILYFSLIAPPDLQLCQPFDHLAKSHRTSIDRKGPIASGFQSLVFYRKPTPLSIAYYRYISFIVVNKVV